MKKQYILAALLAILVIAPSGFAQKKSKSSGASSAHADAQLADLSTKLNLTDDEKTKIKPILDDEASKIHAIKMDKSISDDDKKSKTKPIRDDASKQIRATLTSDQATTYDTISKKGDEGEKKHGGKKAAPAPTPATTPSPGV